MGEIFMTRIDIINSYIEKYNYKSYLEIGVHTGVSFGAVVCEKKIGVDPSKLYDDLTYEMTSDEFFAQNKDTFDIIFIDGLHLSEQVLKDFVNSVNCLNDNGVIILHDCNPTVEEWQYRTCVVNEWTGDVWKTWYSLMKKFPTYKAFTIDTDYGVGVFYGNNLRILEINLTNEFEKLTWNDLENNRKEWLNLITIEEFKQCI